MAEARDWKHSKLLAELAKASPEARMEARAYLSESADDDEEKVMSSVLEPAATALGLTVRQLLALRGGGARGKAPSRLRLTDDEKANLSKLALSVATKPIPWAEVQEKAIAKAGIAGLTPEWGGWLGIRSALVKAKALKMVGDKKAARWVGV